MWFAKVFKRIDKLDDDKEDNKASYFKQSFKIRGGQLWRQTAYSPPFGDIAISFYWLGVLSYFLFVQDYIRQLLDLTLVISLNFLCVGYFYYHITAHDC